MQTNKLVAGILVAAIMLPALPAKADERRIRCESGRSRYRECRVDTEGRVDLVREYSYGKCQQWRTWGYDRRGIWVDRGCRAEFRVGRDNGSGSGTAAAIGVLAGAAIMAAILAGRNKDRGSDGVTAPGWAQGRFRGFSPKEDVAFEISVASDGRVTGTANEEGITGYVASGNRLVLGNAEFSITRESWGFSAAHREDSQNVVYFRKQN